MSIADRLWPKIWQTADDGCWEWQGKRNPYGYGVLALHRPDKTQTTLFAHRAAFALANGVEPGTLDVLHRCDNRACCNPAHLFLGTQRDNNNDRHDKGRTARGSQRPEAKLTEKQVSELRALRLSGLSWTKLARKFGVSAWACRNVVNNLSWKHVP